ncbi:zinc finger and SCAN domain-containing protein 26 [Amyelois transitella]|uniref:zinc finger and SCAN domain-containing protein 26 n=1 Tax=Amyelois transitella TaxID=680683 RepID=UPI00299010E2|nr:zinc finger and SCAN domain-containing protein 26 [Amyelois transitella]
MTSTFITTMFVSQERNSNKKKFQKPNILRRKPKTPVRLSETLNESHSIGSPITIPDVTNATLRGTIFEDLQLENMAGECGNPSETDDKESTQSFNVENTLLYGQMENNSKINPKQNSSQGFNGSGLLVNMVNYGEENSVQSTVNVESFFNSGQNGQNLMLFKLDPKQEMQSFLIIDGESHKNAIYGEQSDDLITSMVPMSAITTSSKKSLSETQEQTSAVVPVQELIQKYTIRPKKFKCDIPDCNKEFRSEQTWQKHKNVHNKDGTTRVPRQVTSECPVKKINADGTEQSCGKIYLIREQLLKHLKEDHTIEDAAYRCEQCGRQFFWATGLRAHARSHSPRARAAASLACGWPGCGRVFSQPCRLREHARAHTGDKPYPCLYPNCGASFRSASKLERHARRHTGLRRHACGTCGRAFLRREHLRDHAARQHAPKPHNLIASPHAECGQVFEEPDALEAHIGSAHVSEESVPSQSDVVDNSLDYMFLTVESKEDATDPQDMEAKSVDLEEGVETGVSDSVLAAAGCAGGEEWGVAQSAAGSRAARTHCPWPLAVHYQTDDDITTEQPEGSESNIYTVRSDLFLHGNVLINEDSVQMGGAVESAEPESAGDELGLGLLEHPHIDLMQEEMMFTVWQ